MVTLTSWGTNRCRSLTSRYWKTITSILSWHLDKTSGCTTSTHISLRWSWGSRSQTQSSAKSSSLLVYYHLKVCPRSKIKKKTVITILASWASISLRAGMIKPFRPLNLLKSMHYRSFSNTHCLTWRWMIKISWLAFKTRPQLAPTQTSCCCCTGS